jgi:hypothetical protein
MRLGMTTRSRRPMNDQPLDLDRHRGKAAQKATDIRRALAEAESYARVLRERQGIIENEPTSIPATFHDS